jgi:hypothetical protein
MGGLECVHFCLELCAAQKVLSLDSSLQLRLQRLDRSTVIDTNGSSSSISSSSSSSSIGSRSIGSSSIGSIGSSNIVTSHTHFEIVVTVILLCLLFLRCTLLCCLHLLSLSPIILSTGVRAPPIFCTPRILLGSNHSRSRRWIGEWISG